jgi:hypothetical protein
VSDYVKIPFVAKEESEIFDELTRVDMVKFKDK